MPRAKDIDGKDLVTNMTRLNQTILPGVQKKISALADTIDKMAKAVDKMSKVLGGMKGGGGKMPSQSDMGGSGSGGSGSSSSIGVGDFLNFAKDTAGGMSKFMANVPQTMQGAANYYNASLMGGQGQTRNSLRKATFSAMGGGLTSAGSDSMVANMLTSSGMSANRSVYGQTVTAVGNAAKYLNMDNSKAAAAISGLTSGGGSSNLLKNFGIYTSDLATGKEKTQGQIFEEMASRMTAGRGMASEEETLDSIRRGNLGESIANSGLSGDQQELFKQFMVARSRGQVMDLSDNKSMETIKKYQEGAGNANPLTGMMAMESAQTNAQNESQDSYIGGINMAAGALTNLADAAAMLGKTIGGVNAFAKTLLSNQQVQGLSDMATAGLNLFDTGLKAAADITNLNKPGATAAMVTGAAGMAGTAAFGAIAASGAMGGDTGGSGAVPAGAQAGGVVSTLVSGASSGSSGSSSLPGSSGGVGQPLANMPKRSASYGAIDKLHPNGHNGDDLPGPRGTAVYAAADGEVVTVVRNQKDYHWNGKGEWPGSKDGAGSGGNQVHIRHTGGYTTLYMHLSKVEPDIKVKATVKKGQKIGEMGSTGRSTGSHLHYAMLDPHGKWADPKTLGQKIGGLGTTDSSSPTASTSDIDIKGVSSTYSAMAGLYSGNIETMKSSLGALMGLMNPGGSSGSKGSGTPMAAKGGEGATSSPAASGGAPSTPPTVNISVNVSGDEDEAKKFATLVAEYLQSNTLTSNMGGY
jgi:murein DD-endopeptidase MepM/ murein hydrolase activator NlpD